MASRNDITGDSLVSRKPNEAFRSNYDNIFRSKPVEIIDTSNLDKEEPYQYSEGGNDECYTPLNAVKVIIPYIPNGAVIWCPFDTKDSEFVKELSKTHKVIYSHIKDGKDFYKYEPEEHWDIIISNPPFTKKAKIFERCLSFNKPFALVMTNTWLNDTAPKKLFKEKELQLLMIDKRIRFIKPNGEVMGQPTFSSSYFCYNLLPKQIIMTELK